jgi:poly(3-hydroxybutyrate) depolymerase
LGALAQAQTINLRGKVINSSGQAISGATVTLVGKNLTATTDGSGAYSITQNVTAISPNSPLHENIMVNRGVLELNLTAPTSVKIEVFDVLANLLKEQSFSEVPAGTFQWNMNQDFNKSSLLIVRTTIGGHASTFRYSPLVSGRYSVKSSAESFSSANALARTTAGTAVDSLEFKATGYATKVVATSSYQDTVNVTLGATDRWGGLNNAPVKSAGCGKALGVLPKSGTYNISTVPGRGTFIIDIPANYNKDNPYRLIFGNHCMGGSAARVAATDNGDKGDDLSGFYSIKTMASKDNIQAIYVAMQGDGGGTWNLPNDATFWNDVLKHVETNLCVDTTRVFVTGFSFGAMFSYVLSNTYPEKIRAVATYAPANYNMTQPTNRHIPIAYFQTTGTNDGTCPWVNNDGQKTGGKYCLLQHMQDNGCTSTASDIKLATSSTHVMTEFKGCKDGYPVKFGSFVGGHQAVHSDPGANFSWIEREAWQFFKQF